MPTLKEYYRRSKAIRDNYNLSWSKAFGSDKPRCPHCNQVLPEDNDDVKKLIEDHHKNAKKTDKQQDDLRKEMIADKEVKDFVCTKTIRFYGKEGQSHYSIDQKIKKRFPMVVCDSESGQGWCYAPESIASKVVDFIKHLVDEVHVSEEKNLTVNWDYKPIV